MDMGARTIQPQRVVLTAEDRCDRCGAQAYAAARLEGGLDLLFCCHHWREHGAAVRIVAVDVHDDTARITENRVRDAEGSRPGDSSPA